MRVLNGAAAIATAAMGKPTSKPNRRHRSGRSNKDGSNELDL